MIGAFIGAIVLGILQNGFHVISVSSFAYDLILGLAILIAMFINIQMERATTRGAGKGSFARLLKFSFGRGKEPVRE